MLAGYCARCRPSFTNVDGNTSEGKNVKAQLLVPSRFINSWQVARSSRDFGLSGAVSGVVRKKQESNTPHLSVELHDAKVGHPQRFLFSMLEPPADCG
jgi:hypothetical protein